MSARSWFVWLDGKQEGPFSGDEFKDLIARGQITPDTLIWSDGMPDWLRAADLPGVLSAVPPPPSRRPGASPRNDGRPGDRLAADFGVWAFFWRLFVLILGALLVIPAPWVFTYFYRWAIAHVHVPQRPELGFTGKVGDIWWVFVLTGLSSLAGPAHVRFLPLLLIPFQAALSWVTIRWVVANISSRGRHLPLSFSGSIWAYIGWNILLVLSFVTIIGWAWVQTALVRWMCRNIQGTTRAVSFNASGWDMLWRMVVYIVTVFLIIPIPWTTNWIARWYVSQFSLAESAG